MKVIAVTSQKGGTGKTTLSGHLAVQAERAGLGPVVMIDCDPQGSLTNWWNYRQADTPILVQTSLAKLADDLASLPRQLSRGESLSDAIAPSRYLSAQAYHLMHSGEAAGRLAEAIRGFCAAEAAEIEAFDDQVAAWIPRIVYVAVLVFLGGSMVSSGLPLP